MSSFDRQEKMPEIRTEMERLQFFLTECENLRRKDTFPSFKEQLKLFMNMLQKYTDLFKKKTGGISANNDDYDAFLKELQEVSFSCSKWLNDKKADLKILQQIFKSLKSKGIPFVSREGLKSKLISDQTTRYVVCLHFTLPSLDEDAQFLDMQAFLNKCEMQKFAESVDVPLFRKEIEGFIKLKDDNLLNKDVKFVATEERLSSLSSCDKPDVRVRVYDKGVEVEHFRHSKVNPYVVGSVILAGVAVVVAVVLKYK